MLHGNEAKKSSELIPPPRHRHSSVVFDQGMWVYGGMTDLQDRSDFWRLDFGKIERLCFRICFYINLKCLQWVNAGVPSSASIIRVHCTATLLFASTRACSSSAERSRATYPTKSGGFISVLQKPLFYLHGLCITIRLMDCRNWDLGAARDLWAEAECTDAADGRDANRSSLHGETDRSFEIFTPAAAATAASDGSCQDADEWHLH